ncbi:MAG: hypothetical protein JW741_05115 [Sedimentisphaerales bacterium]|nr:hypothetical protein [Sedimentisphaerales bacterium]
MGLARPRTILQTIPLLIAVCFVGRPAHARYSGGTGEPNDPYQIATAADLIALGETPDDYHKHFILTAAIDLDPTLPGRKVFGKAVIGPDTDDAANSFQGTAFTGVFDGNGYTISHLRIIGGGDLGLFGQVGSGGRIVNLGLVDASVDAGAGKNVGTLVGYNCIGTIENCYSSGAVSGGDDVGGLVGWNYIGTVANCYSIATVLGNDSVGGLAGANSGGSIVNCYAAGDVSGNEGVGGLLGSTSNYSEVLRCYSCGVVAGNDFTGGLIGFHTTTGVSGTVSLCYWDVDASRQSASGGGTGKTTPEMLRRDTYRGWGYDGAWTIDEDNEYPRLVWENHPGVAILETPPTYGGGSGDPDDPFRITTAEQLAALGFVPSHWDKHFVLMTNVGFSSYSRTDLNPIGHSQAGFTGHFDGNGHTIADFSYEDNSGEIGFFGRVGFGGRITNLGLLYRGGTISGHRYVGGLAGFNCGTIANCYVRGSISAYSEVGGLVGHNYGAITDCYANVDVSGGYHGTGGLVGYNEGRITTSYATGTVATGFGPGTTAWKYNGGLVGANVGTITNCHASSDVTGIAYSGGLVGNNGGEVSTCYSCGAVSGSDRAGGLVASGSGTVEQSYWDVETSGQPTSAGGTGKTTADMMRSATYSGWGRGAVWTIAEGQDYPRFSWEDLPGGPTRKGGGTADDPYRIWTALQLNEIGLHEENWDKHFVLMDDIDLSGSAGSVFIDCHVIVPGHIREFEGVFDGNGHTISHFAYESEDGPDLIGLFGTVGRDGRIVNLGLEDVILRVGSGADVGALAGRNYGSLSNCYATGAVSGDARVGGLVGCNDGTISDCSAVAETSGNECIGGLVGRNEGAVLRCHSGGTVSGDSSVGGLVGRGNRGSSVSESFSISVVLGSSEVGGLVGTAEGPTSNCYASGEVSGTERVGGLAGANSGAMSGCYSCGNVSGSSEAGGLAGYSTARIYLSFWDTDRSGCLDSDGGRGKGTVEMMQMATYRGWGRAGAWTLDDGNDYPKLAWENAPGAPIVDALGGYGGGMGTAEDPYQIRTAEQINEIGTNPYDWDGHFVLMADLDLSGLPGRQFNMAGEDVRDGPADKPFTGAFDGNGHTIAGLTYRSDREQRNTGLFSYIGRDGKVENLTLVDVKIDVPGNSVGALAGYNRGFISNCHVAGVLSGGATVGGLVGRNSGGTVVDCSFEGSVAGAWGVGGIVGDNNGCGYTEPEIYLEGLIIHCRVAPGDVTGGYYVGDYVGGIAGYNGDGIIAGCYAENSVTGGGVVGGLAGGNEFGTISNSRAAGSVSGQEGIGGLVGVNGGEDQWARGEIINCYSVAGVVGDAHAGGLVGINERGRISASFWDVQVSGQAEMCGFRGDTARGCDDSCGKTTAEMQNQATFVDAGWDFDRPVWVIQPQDYPTLAWMVPDADAPRTISDCVFAVSIGMGHTYGYPDDPSDTTYRFWLDILADAGVEKVAFLTPGGETFEIPKLRERQEPNEPVSGVVLETGREFDAESCAFEWHYDVESADLADLDPYGDGYYTLVVVYTDGEQDQTTVWFGVPGTDEPIVQPTQQPTFTSFVQGESVFSPVLIAWEPCVHPTVNVIHAGLENDQTGQEEGQLFDGNATGMPQPLVLAEGVWEAWLAFATWYDTQNADGIDVELVKYCESECILTVVPGP